MAKQLVDRFASLRELTGLAAGRVPEELTERSRSVLERADTRLSLGEQTVVALAGATGSGKSTLFNAIAGRRLAEEGARRPTTSQTFAVSFAATNTSLLDWLEIKRSSEVEPTSKGLEQLVLLDLPDHDSTEVAHRQEVDRMVQVVDQFIFVLDPQKYADAAIHQRYLRPLAQHREVITVVLNQTDRLSPEQLKACLADLRRHLDADGLTDVPLLATSARTGAGVAELRDRLARLAAKKSAASIRLTADVAVLARDYGEAIGQATVTEPARDVVLALNQSLALAAGVPVVTDAVRASMVLRGKLATGWPLVKWLTRFRPDPLRRLRIGGKPKPALTAGSPEATERSSLPMRGSVADARLSTALRALATQLSAGMPRLWQQAISGAVQSNAAALPDSLDRVIVTADLGTQRTPLWWQVLRGLQWLLIVAVVVGALWLGANFAMLYFQLPPLPLSPVTFPNGLAVPLPTLLVIGGLLGGVALSIGSRVFVGLGARGAARRAGAVLRRRVAEVGRDEVLAPARMELDRYQAARSALKRLR